LICISSIALFDHRSSSLPDNLLILVNTHSRHLSALKLLTKADVIIEKIKAEASAPRGVLLNKKFLGEMAKNLLDPTQ
jgi:hypothetical protein